MDTVEELNSTYFYAGRSNLTASQLHSHRKRLIRKMRVVV